MTVVSALVNHLYSPTVAAVLYGPNNQHFVSLTVLRTGTDLDCRQAEVRQQFDERFGTAVQDWRHLRTHLISYALLMQSAPGRNPPVRPVCWPFGIYVCCENRQNASIKGAMDSGRRAEEALLEDLA